MKGGNNTLGLPQPARKGEGKADFLMALTAALSPCSGPFGMDRAASFKWEKAVDCHLAQNLLQYSEEENGNISEGDCDAMRRSLNILFLIVLFVFLPYSAHAVVAYPGVVEVMDQPSGKIIQIRNYGDEFFSYSTDLNGYLLAKDSAGTYRYVVEQKGAFAMGASVVGGETARFAMPQAPKVHRSEGVSGWENKLRQMRDSANRNSGWLGGGSTAYQPAPIPPVYDYKNDPLRDKLFPITELDHPSPPLMGSTCPLLVLVVEFADIKSAFNDTEWDQAFFQKISEYYESESNGRFTYVPARETYNVAHDGIIKITLPFAMPRYALPANDNQNAGTGVYSGIYAGQQPFQDRQYAIFNDSSLFGYGIDVAAKHIDLKTFDKNGDGYISPTELGVLVVVAGYEASAIGRDGSSGLPAVWGHSWQLNNSANIPGWNSFSQSVLVEGVKLYKYTMIGENLNSQYDYENPSAPGTTPIRATHGVACHELGHDMGLRDLYDTGYADLSKNVGALSLMADGNWGNLEGEEMGSCPSSLDPYSKAYLRFYETTPVSGSGIYPLYHSAAPERYGMLEIRTASPDVTYLVENRQFSGNDSGMWPFYWDEYGGVVIWRIDSRAIQQYWAANKLNSVEGHFAIMPVFLKDDDGYETPFFNALTTKPGEAFIAQASPAITIASHDAPAARMRVEVKISEPILKTPPATGDGGMPLVWCAYLMMSVLGLIALIRQNYRIKNRAGSLGADEPE